MPAVLDDLVAEVVAVFHEDRGSSQNLGRTEAYPVEGEVLDLDAGDAEVHVLARCNLIEIKARKINAQFVDQ